MEKTQAMILISALLLLAFVLNLVRLRQLREEYSWLWLAACTFYLVMAIKPDLVKTLTEALGITNPITAIIFYGLLFVILILINYSVKLTRLAKNMKDVAQQIAILDGEHKKIHQLRKSGNVDGAALDTEQLAHQQSEAIHSVDSLACQAGASAQNKK